MRSTSRRRRPSSRPRRPPRTRGWKAWEEKTSWYLGELKAKGMKVQPPSAALKDGFKKIGEQLTEDWLKKAGGEGKTLVDAYKKM